MINKILIIVFNFIIHLYFQECSSPEIVYAEKYKIDHSDVNDSCKDDNVIIIESDQFDHSDVSSLYRENKVVTGEPERRITDEGMHEWGCYYCDFQAQRKSIVRRHIYTHMMEKPFSCKLCSFTTSGRNHIDRHIRYHLKYPLF